MPLPPIPPELVSRLADAVAAGWRGREDRHLGVQLVREELEQNDFALRRALLEGLRGEGLSRERYDRAFSVFRHRTLRGFSTGIGDLYERISPGVQAEVASGSSDAAVMRRLNQLAVATGRARDDLDRYLGETGHYLNRSGEFGNGASAPRAGLFGSQ